MTRIGTNRREAIEHIGELAGASTEAEACFDALVEAGHIEANPADGWLLAELSDAEFFRIATA